MSLTIYLNWFDLKEKDVLLPLPHAKRLKTERLIYKYNFVPISNQFALPLAAGIIQTLDRCMNNVQCYAK